MTEMEKLAIDVEAGKRTLKDTSFDSSFDSVKKQHMSSPHNEPIEANDDPECPRWARTMSSNINTLLSGQNEMIAQMAELNDAHQSLKLDVAKQGGIIVELHSQVSINEDRLERIERQVLELSIANEDLTTTNASMQGEIDKLRDTQADTDTRLNKQIDNGLRDHITFHGLPKEPGEKLWDYEHTTKVLAEWLAKTTGKPYKLYDDAIERAHRGPINKDKPGPPVIYCKMRWRIGAQVRDYFIKKGHRIGSVEIKKKFSEDTQSRVNEALIHRKKLRGAEGGKELKLKVDYPARLMVKAPGEERYRLEKAF